MVAHTLRLNRATLTGVGKDEARKRVNRVVRRTFNRSQVLVPVDTGNLRATGRMIIGGIEYTARYAAAVHNGRRALTIRAKGNGRLKFTVDGRTVYARSVHQPARKARPYLAQALREVAPQQGFRLTIG
jgi:hypothetical protein